MTSTELCIILKRKLKRHVSANELKPVAESLGKIKVIIRARSAQGSYQWEESEIEKVIEML